MCLKGMESAYHNQKTHSSFCWYINLHITFYKTIPVPKLFMIMIYFCMIDNWSMKGYMYDNIFHLHLSKTTPPPLYVLDFYFPPPPLTTEIKTFFSCRPNSLVWFQGEISPVFFDQTTLFQPVLRTSVKY